MMMMMRSGSGAAGGLGGREGGRWREMRSGRCDGAMLMRYRCEARWYAVQAQNEAAVWRRERGNSSGGPTSAGMMEEGGSGSGSGKGDGSEDDVRLQYTSTLGEALRRVKTLSVAGLCASTLAVPIVHIATSSGGSAPLLVPLSMLVFSGSTTALLHWFSSPYILRMFYSERRDELELETLAFPVRTVRHVISMDDVVPPPEGSLHPLGTFSAGDKSFYFDTEHRFVNTLLLKRIITQAQPPSASDDEGGNELAQKWDDDDDDEDDDDRDDTQRMSKAEKRN